MKFKFYINKKTLQVFAYEENFVVTDENLTDKLELKSNGEPFPKYDGSKNSDGVYLHDNEFLNNINKKDLLQKLRFEADKITNIYGLGIENDEPNPERKKNAYQEKRDWALLKKSQIDNGDTNIDYSPYEAQAIRFNSLKDSLGITETDVNKAYVYIVLNLNNKAKTNLATIEENEYSLEESIKNAQSLEQLESIDENMESILKQNII